MEVVGDIVVGTAARQLHGHAGVVVGKASIGLVAIVAGLIDV